jgi:hypothetical protein
MKKMIQFKLNWTLILALVGMGETSMKRFGYFLSLATLSLTTAFQAPVMAGEHSEKGMKTHGSASELKTEMRKLWEDHITYTRNYIISALADLGDKEAVAKRLLKNQDDIGDSIKPYYGAEAGKKLAALLRDHILVATKVVDAAKTNNQQELETQQKKWTENGREIAAFLSGANSTWKKSDLEQMLQKHLDLTTGEVVGRLKKDWEADIKSYDEGHAHMLMFADALADGVVKQFPEKTSRTSPQVNR